MEKWKNIERCALSEGMNKEKCHFFFRENACDQKLLLLTSYLKPYLDEARSKSQSLFTVAFRLSSRVLARLKIQDAFFDGEDQDV